MHAIKFVLDLQFLQPILLAEGILLRRVEKDLRHTLSLNCWLKRVLHLCNQRAKKVEYDSPGLVDFAIRLVNSVFNLPNRQVMCFEEFE